MRKISLVNDEYYHIYNRGVDKRDVFMDEKDYVRFLAGMQEFNREEPVGSLYVLNRHPKPLKASDACSPLVQIICYCLNPNHYHFILCQLVDGGISKFMHKISMGYTNYFNKKNKRTGALFQGKFKSTHIDSNELLLYLSAYVNCNSEVHDIAKAEDYKWCSFPDYIGKREENLCEKEIILDQFKSIKDYKKVALESAQNMRKRREMEKLLLE